MSKRLTGLNPLAYIGVEAITPPQMYIADRPPRSNDSRNFNLGDLWLDKNSENLYVLASLARGVAVWVTSSGATTFETDNGEAVDIGGVIGLFGDGSTITTAATGANEITFSLTQGLDGQVLIGADLASAQWADITSADNSVLITQGANTLDLTVDPSVVIGNGTNGQLLIGGGSSPQWASLTSDGSIVITPGVNTLQITAPSATGLTTVNTNSGAATQVAGAISLLGNAANITTSGTGSTVTVSVKNGTNGQLLIGGGANATWANLTSGGGTVTITNGANTINLEATGGGSSGASTFITDAGNAIQSLGNITILGGNNISTSGAGQTVTINLNDTTNHALQVGNASGSLTSLAVATNGQIPIGRTGLDPVMATITAGSGVSIVNASGSITISAAGGGSGDTIVTAFTSDGVWAKNVATKYVEVYGWGGGGGGGSGGLGSTVGMGGTGGGATSMFHIYGPAVLFGNTETVTVGVGGNGGASVNTSNTVGNDGIAGTPSRFGSSIVPANIASGPSQGAGSFGRGGQINVNGLTVGSGYAGIFQMGFGNIFNSFPGQAASARANKSDFGGAGGSSSFSNGSNGLPMGGEGSANIYAYAFMLPTGGGGGSPWNSGGAFDTPGGNGGDYFAFDGTTVISAGGLGGQSAGSPNGANGTSVMNTSGSYLAGSGGIIMGGTGGGAGKGRFGTSTPGIGGNGGFPGGGGGGGGGSANGTPSGAGGDGADGIVIVIEWT